MDNNISRGGDWSIIKQSFTLVKPYRNWIILSILCAVAIAVCDVISGTLIRKLIDNILKSNDVVIFNL